jgi:thiol-disulfide isomerase/thioredoxin
MRNSRIARNIAIATGVVVLAFFILLVTAKPRGERGISTPLLGNPAPAVSSPLIGGGTFELARRKGSWVVLNFFNSTCVPCRIEHPQLVAFEKNQSGLENKAELITVVNDDSDDAETKDAPVTNNINNDNVKKGATATATAAASNSKNDSADLNPAPAKATSNKPVKSSANMNSSKPIDSKK